MRLFPLLFIYKLRFVHRTIATYIHTLGRVQLHILFIIGIVVREHRYTALSLQRLEHLS